MARGLGDVLGDTVGEFTVAAVACLLFAGATGAALRGWHHAPRSTVALGVGLVLLVVYGGVATARGSNRPRGLLTSIAVVAFVFVAVWLTYVLSYCACR